MLARAVAAPLGLEVDPAGAGEDRARLFFAPRAAVADKATGEVIQRDAEVCVLRREPIAVGDLVAAAPAIAERPIARRPADARFAEARDAGLDAHDAIDYRALRRRCPTCGHKGYFGPLPPDKVGGLVGRWYCFSSHHAIDSRVAGKPCGRASRTHEGAYWGDALDIEAHRRKASVAAVLREDGFDPGEAPTIPDPEPTPVERLALGDARERVRELLDDAATRGISIDLVATAGVGKSTAAIEAEVDRLMAWTLTNTDAAPPLSIIAIGAGRGLALERLAMVRELIGDAEIDVRLGLGRQALEDDGTPPAHGFACEVHESVGSRVRIGLAGCHRCPFAQHCTGTTGHYLHDWAAVAAAAKAGPTIIVSTVAALPTVWSRGTRRTTGVRVILDDAPNVHAGHVTSTEVDAEARGLARTTAALGRRIARKTGLGQLVGESVDRAAMTGRHVADPAIVAAVASLLLPALSRGRDALGRRLAKLAITPTIGRYAQDFAFGRGHAAEVADDRGASWAGIGVCAMLWSLLRDVVGSRARPVVDGDEIRHVDLHLLRLPRARLGVAPLGLGRELRFDEAVEIVVDADRDVLAATPPITTSWGDRGAGSRDTTADRYADATIADLHAAHSAGLVVVAGLREEARAPEGCRIAITGRDDLATNAYEDATAIVLRRTAAPFDSVALEAAAVLAGTGWADNLPDLAVPTGLTPVGARLPADDRVRRAWIETRSAALRNGLGRARAAKRSGEAIDLVALDQDAGRWPWLSSHADSAPPVTSGREECG